MRLIGKKLKSIVVFGAVLPFSFSPFAQAVTTVPYQASYNSTYRKSIPLSQALQTYLRRQCLLRGVDYELALALIKVESNFNPNLISSTHDYGLMQINQADKYDLTKRLGIKDFMNPYNNIRAGVYMLGNLKHYGTHKMLMAYNFGEYGMKRVVRRGISSSRYSRLVMKEREGIKRAK